MLTQDEQQVLVLALAELGVPEERPRANATYVRVGRNYYDLAEVVLALLTKNGIASIVETDEDLPADFINQLVIDDPEIAPDYDWGELTYNALKSRAADHGMKMVAGTSKDDMIAYLSGETQPAA